MGRLHPKKGLELLIDAFVAASEAVQAQAWRLLIAGDGEPDYVARLRDLVRARAASDRVLFTGWLGGADKIGVLQGAAVLALPSRQENFGLVVAEAMACRVPVLISTEVNLADEVRSAGAGWVVPLESAPLTSALKDVFRSDEERHRRGAAGWTLASSKFTSAAVAGKLTALYERLCRHQPA
jgi:glycosyltransferase involved in cell wall biosynthesis